MTRRFLACLLGMSISLAACADPVWVGRFSETDTAIPAPWKIEHLDQGVPPTEYAVRKCGDVVAIEAEAMKSMALFCRTVTVDLKNAPILYWQWRIDAAWWLS